MFNEHDAEVFLLFFTQGLASTAAGTKVDPMIE
jgi:hypothetical protein